MNITTGQELRDKIEAKRYDTFTFPILEITIKYRKPDLLKLSLSNALPGAMADAVISAYKEAMSGADMEEYKTKLESKKPEADENLVKDIASKGFTLLGQLCVSHKIMDVQESDPDNNLIAFSDIPEEDAIAFLLNLLNKAQNAKTETGGEVSVDEITTFSDSGRVSKRNSVSKNG